jgi:hypothetical protein
MAMFKKDLCKLKTQIFGLGPIIMSLIYLDIISIFVVGWKAFLKLGFKSPNDILKSMAH